MLVYYSPAYLRSVCTSKAIDEARDALHALAEVYRAARTLWPLEDGGAASNVTVMIDELKGCATRAEVLGAYSAGFAWVLVQSSATEASVRKRPLSELPELLGGGKCVLLPLWAAAGA